MEDMKNQLVLSQNKFDLLLLALEEKQIKASLDASCIQTKIRMQIGIVDYCMFVVDKGTWNLKIHNETTNAHNNLDVLE
jgi:hypothetical protein